MNKKFLVVALMAALSTVGYAYDMVLTDDRSVPLVNDINSNFEAVQGDVDKINESLGNKLDVNDFFTAQNENNNYIQGQLDGKVDQVQMDKVNEKLENKLDKGEFFAEQNKNNQFIQDQLNGKVDQAQMDKVNEKLENKLDKDEFFAEQNKNNQFIQDQLNGKVDQAQMDKVNEKLENKLDKDEFFAEQNKNNQFIQDQLNGKVDKAEQEKVDAEQDKVIANKADKNYVDAENKKQDEVIKDHGDRLTGLEGKFAGYDGRLSGLEKKVDHLDDKMNKGLSLMAAMNAVDFQNVQTGEMALGAGIGHYGNAQSVALGVAYAPVEDLTVNAKYSITAGDPDSFAVGAGATYKFKVGR